MSKECSLEWLRTLDTFLSELGETLPEVHVWTLDLDGAKAALSFKSLAKTIHSGKDVDGT